MHYLGFHVFKGTVRQFNAKMVMQDPELNPLRPLSDQLCERYCRFSWFNSI